jgi:hypothetical protein
MKGGIIDHIQYNWIINIIICIVNISVNVKAWGQRALPTQPSVVKFLTRASPTELGPGPTETQNDK